MHRYAVVRKIKENGSDCLTFVFPERSNQDSIENLNIRLISSSEADALVRKMRKLYPKEHYSKVLCSMKFTIN